MTISDTADRGTDPQASVIAGGRAHTRRPRASRERHYVMTPPAHFAVEYAINPWMDTTTDVDSEVAMNQWESLRDTYLDLGHTVHVVDPVSGLPDMVFAANGALIVGETAVIARFAYPQRAAEAKEYSTFFADRGHRTAVTRHVNEGQGDFLVAGSIILGGYGFRTDIRAHDEIARLLQMPVVSLELIDPRFYHLDTALAVLDDATIAYYPPAFSDESRQRIAEMFPDAIEAASADAYVLGLNAVSDGHHVVLPAAATGMAEQLREAGFEPVAVELSEMLKAGGSVKCCTLEVHS